jgi:segregation and condensation protein A
MTSLNLNVAGDFLVMAATLVHIKSRMLLPADETEADEEDGPDPREDLVRRLLEYKRYKEAADRLDERERLWREVFTRETPPASMCRSDESPLEEVTLFDLVDSLQAMLARVPDQRLLEISTEHLTVKDRINAILESLEGKESMAFESLFHPGDHRFLIIVTFLALLELIRLKLVRVCQGAAFGPILVMRAFSPVGEREINANRLGNGWEAV